MELKDYIKLDFRYYLIKHIESESKKPLNRYSITEIKKIITGKKETKIRYEKQYADVKKGKFGFQDLFNEIESYLLHCIDGNALPVHFVRDFKSKSFKILRFAEYGEMWETFDFYKFLIQESREEELPKLGRVFVSHSSKDEDLVRAFVDRILLLGFGMRNVDVFCTSIDGMGIRSGEDFHNTIKKKLQTSEVIIQLITENYKKSEICLNEMGAAWVLNTKVIPFIVAPIQYDNVGFIHNTTQLLRLNKKQDLLKFKDDYKELSNSNEFNSSIYDQQIDEFLKIFQLKGIEFKPHRTSQIPSQNEIEIYFKRFLEPDIDILGLMIKAQPNLADCKAIFTEKFFQEVYSFNSIMYRTMLERKESWDQISTKDVFDINSITKKELEKSATNEKKRIFVESLKPNVTFFTINFKNYGAEYGTSFSFWAFVNGRWVFFPKPWRTIYSLADIQNDQTFEKIVKTINRFGLGKELNNGNVEMEFFITHLIHQLKKRAK